MLLFFTPHWEMERVKLHFLARAKFLRRPPQTGESGVLFDIVKQPTTIFETEGHDLYGNVPVYTRYL